ncbi:MAG: hypothetical protein AAFP87_19370 [Pseudomonadota bacterium]
MQVSSRMIAGPVGLVLLALVGCGPEGGLGPSSFQSQYGVARSALESGRYSRAIASYGRLMDMAGPAQNHIRLELAHAYLRDGQFAAAAREARILAQATQGQDRAAALSVQGTADHEMGLAALSQGDRARGFALFRQADAAMQTVVTDYPDLDPLGSLAARRASIKVRLGT